MIFYATLIHHAPNTAPERIGERWSIEAGDRGVAHQHLRDLAAKATNGTLDGVTRESKHIARCLWPADREDG